MYIPGKAGQGYYVQLTTGFCVHVYSSLSTPTVLLTSAVADSDTRAVEFGGEPGAGHVFDHAAVRGHAHVRGKGCCFCKHFIIKHSFIKRDNHEGLVIKKSYKERVLSTCKNYFYFKATLHL